MTYLRLIICDVGNFNDRLMNNSYNVTEKHSWRYE
jgi:hypothetical protein